MVEIRMHTVSGWKPLTAMMRAVDMFDENKVVGDIHEYTITRKSMEGFEPQKVINATLQAAKQSKISIWFIGFPDIIDAPTFLEPGINVLSTGKQWTMFKDTLKRLGYNVITDDRYRVLAAENRLMKLEK